MYSASPCLICPPPFLVAALSSGVAYVAHRCVAWLVVAWPVLCHRCPSLVSCCMHPTSVTVHIPYRPTSSHVFHLANPNAVRHGRLPSAAVAVSATEPRAGGHASTKTGALASARRVLGRVTERQRLFSASPRVVRGPSSESARQAGEPRHIAVDR